MKNSKFKSNFDKEVIILGFIIKRKRALKKSCRTAIHCWKSV